MSGAMSGARIRALRQQLGLSQIALAELLGISNVTVNRWENDRAVPHPATLARLERMEQEGIAPSQEPLPARRGNLPGAFTPLIGREAAIAEVSAALQRAPLVTISGVAGAGKTRLAVAVGRETARQWPDGVWFVDLAAVQEPEAVLHSVARVLGLREAGRKPLLERVGDAFREQSMLLLLDNCEHLVSPCAELARELLRTESASRLLATSRVSLGVAGEALLPLRPLAQPDAVELFVARARVHQPGLVLDAATSATIKNICQRLDGLPLAIELAAARCRVLAIAQIAARLDQRFSLLQSGEGAPRQRALNTAIAWSYDLLTPPEATLFRAMGVFSGWFDLHAVEAVIARDDAIDLLDSLARQSMIVVDHDLAGQARYRLLESLAEFARQQLAWHGEATEVGQRHAAYYRNLAQEISPGLRGAQQAALLARLDREHDNLMAALEWLLAAQEVEDALTLASSLGLYWQLRGRYAEGLALLDRALDQEGAPVNIARAAALRQRGTLQNLTGDLRRARVTLLAAVALAHELAAQGEEALASDMLGLVQAGLRDFDAARVAHTAARDLALAVGDRAQAAMSTMHLGQLSNVRGGAAVAERAYREAWSLVKGTEDTTAQAVILSNLGDVAARLGRFERALGYYRQSRQQLNLLGNPDRLAAVDTNIAEVQVILGESAGAVPLIADAVARFREIGNLANLAAATYIEAAALAGVGRLADALLVARESLAIYHQMDDWLDTVYALEMVARILTAGDDAVVAARLLGGVQRIRAEDQIADYPLFDTAGGIAAVRTALARETLEANWAEGQEMAREDLVAEALHVGAISDGAPLAVMVRRQPGLASRRVEALTERQIDVLQLAAEGMSNREIGHELGISDRTVDRHLTSIYGVLDVDRRAAAVARATALGLLREPRL